MSSQTKLRRTLALVLAGGSLAIGVPAALAAGGTESGTGSESGAPATRLVQDEQQPDQNRPDHDCPERDGGGSGSGSSDSGTSTPEV